MATVTHPVTGIPLNDIAIKRTSLDEIEAVTACIMHKQGHTFTDIAQSLGTNANRVGEVFSGKVWPDAERKARKMIGGDLFKED
jgi:hypothetical protein